MTVRIELTQEIFDAAKRGRADLADAAYLRKIFEAAGFQVELTSAETEEIARLRASAARLLESADEMQRRPDGPD